MKEALILSDGRQGHLNQSVAFAKYMGLSYDIVPVKFKYKPCKMLSYLFDKIGIDASWLFDAVIDKRYRMVIGTGSSTYYAVKVLSRSMGAKSVAMMLPKGYRYDFDLIFAQSHDRPPGKKNIIEIPANFSYIRPKGLYQPQKRSVGIIIGGSNALFEMKPGTIKRQLDHIVKHYQEEEIAVTTSPRTPKEVEGLVESYGFDYEVVFSKNPVNPIPDFLENCETVFITADSTSMISEAISYGKSNVVVLPLESKRENKFVRFIETLSEEGYLHIFDGMIVNKNKKIDFSTYLPKEII
ncbi:MAG: ELM1/GtrOC1 family putative glycosyltransferase [Sulfurimonas sp.]